jgi:hypothetical protein
MDVKPLGTAVRVGTGYPVGDRRVLPGLAGVRALGGPGSRLGKARPPRTDTPSIRAVHRLARALLYVRYGRDTAGRGRRSSDGLVNSLPTGR